MLIPVTKMTNTGPFLWNEASKIQFFTDFCTLSVRQGVDLHWFFEIFILAFISNWNKNSVINSLKFFFSAHWNFSSVISLNWKKISVRTEKKNQYKLTELFFSAHWNFFSVLMEISKNQWRSTGGEAVEYSGCYFFENWFMKLIIHNLLKPLGTITQQNYWSFYSSELIYFAFFTMRHPVLTWKTDIYCLD